MAVIRPLFIDPTNAFPTEVDPTADSVDALSFSANPASPGDPVFDAGGGKLVNLAEGTAGTDGVTKSQLDSVAAGFDPKASCRLKTVASLSTWTPAGSGVGKTLTSPDNLVANNDFDGVTAALGDRILVTFAGVTEGANLNNGIYEVTQLATGAVPTILTRATDFDGTPSGEVSAGAFTFVTEGSTEADTGWYVTTNDPITVDTTPIAFSQFAGVGTFTGGDGIDITAGVISVDLGTDPGLEFVSGELEVLVNPAGAIEKVTAGIGVILEATNPSLQIVANELGIKFDPAGALVKGAAGTAVNLETTNPTLQIVANELGVKLDPAGAIVTGAGGVAVQVDGVTIQINGSNQLEVIGAGDANRVANDYTVAAGGVTAGDPVYFSANDTVDDADANRSVGTGNLVIGIAETTEPGAGTVSVVTEGPVTGVLTALSPTAGDAVYLANGGGLTLTPPGLFNTRFLVGYAINADDLYVKTQLLGLGAP